MTDEPTPEPRKHRTSRTLLVLFVTTTVVSGVLQVASQLGAKRVLEDVATDTSDALKALRPLDLGRRYGQILEGVIAPCTAVPEREQRACWQEHSTTNLSLPTEIGDVFQALFILVRQIMADSWTAAVINLLQLLAGFTAATIIVTRLGVIHPYLLGLAFIPFAILCSCLLALPTLALLYIGSAILGEVLPPPLTLGVVTGMWGAFMVACSGRTLEALVHERVAGVINRVLRG